MKPYANTSPIRRRRPRGHLLAAAIICAIIACILIVVWLFPAHASAAPADGIRLRCANGGTLICGWLPTRTGKVYFDCRCEKITRRA